VIDPLREQLILVVCLVVNVPLFLEMIDPLREHLIPPNVATRYYPKDQLGRKVHVATVYRHLTVGVRGVVLESIKTPRLCTSMEAIARFFSKLSERPTGDVTATDNVKNIAEFGVEAELDRLGI
jgi:Protein of unknown function (DUF1580)